MNRTPVAFKMDRKTLLASAIFMVVVLVALVAMDNGRMPVKVDYPHFLDQIRAGQVTNVTISGDAIYRLRDGGIARTALPADARDVFTLLSERHVEMEVQQPLASRTVFINSIPFLLLLGFWVFMMARLRNRPHAH